MGKWKLTRVSNFAYPCKHCGKKHPSAYMADICYQLDLKIITQDKRHLIPLKGNEHLLTKKII